MSRQRHLVETFVTLADTLVDDFDVIDFLQVLAERCVDLLDVAAAGIMLADETGALRHAACSDEQMRLVELFELQIGEGPCYDAYNRAAVVRCNSTDEATARWPQFAPTAIERGFVSLAGVPMRLREQVIGALNVFDTTSDVLSDDDVRLVQALADVATIGILQERAIHDAAALTTQLREALESRVLIEQAKGIVAEHGHVSVDDAFARIREFTRAHNRLLRTTANDIVIGALRPEQLADTTQERSGPR